MKRLLVAILILTAAGSTYAQTIDFFELVKTGTPQSVQAAINKGADVNSRDTAGLTALMYAATQNQNPDVTTVLLNAGADLKAVNRDGLRD